MYFDIASSKLFAFADGVRVGSSLSPDVLVVLLAPIGTEPVATERVVTAPVVSAPGLQPQSVAAAIRAVRKAQQALQADPARATEAARQRFPPQETALIAELIRRDLPYYDPTISAEVVSTLQDFAQHVGLLAAPVPYEHVVAVECSHLWER